MIQPPKCKACGKAEWHHVCTGAADAEVTRRVTKHVTPNVTKRVTVTKNVTSDVTKPVTSTPDVTKSVTWANERIDELEAEVKRLKRELAEANKALAGLDLVPARPMTAAERKRKQRAKQGGQQDFKG